MRPVGPHRDVWVHPVLRAEPQDGRPVERHGRRAACCLTASVVSGRETGDQPAEQRLLVVQLPGAGAGHGGLQLLVVPHHHQLPEAKSERDQSFRLHTLRGLVHYTHGDLPAVQVMD